MLMWIFQKLYKIHLLHTLGFTMGFTMGKSFYPGSVTDGAVSQRSTATLQR